MQSVEPEPECRCYCVGDQADASECPLHGKDPFGDIHDAEEDFGR